MKLKKHETHSTHPNVVPMIDVIMCLIIFYMLVARIGVNTGEDESIKIPFAKLSTDIKSMDNTLLVNVKEVNSLPEVSAMVDNTKGGREKLVLSSETDPRSLERILRRFRFGKDLKKGGKGEAADNEDFKLVVRGDKDMTFGTLQVVLLEAAKAEVKAFNFQTSSQEVRKD